MPVAQTTATEVDSSPTKVKPAPSLRQITSLFGKYYQDYKRNCEILIEATGMVIDRLQKDGSGHFCLRLSWTYPFFNAGYVTQKDVSAIRENFENIKSYEQGEAQYIAILSFYKDIIQNSRITSLVEDIKIIIDCHIVAYSFDQKMSTEKVLSSLTLDDLISSAKQSHEHYLEQPDSQHK